MLEIFYLAGDNEISDEEYEIQQKVIENRCNYDSDDTEISNLSKKEYELRSYNKWDSNSDD